MNRQEWWPHEFRKNYFESQKKNGAEEHTLGIGDEGVEGGKANRSYDTDDNSKSTFSTSYVLCKHNHESVYAKFAGARYTKLYISTWVPKTLATITKLHIMQCFPNVKA